MKTIVEKNILGGKKTGKNQSGFSLVEVIIAMFVFALVSMMILSAFFDVFQARRKVRAVQQNVEDARYAMEAMAKTLRTSSVFSINSNGDSDSIAAYDYSQGKCLRYRLDGIGNLEVAEGTAHCLKNKDGDKKIWVDSCDGFVAGKKMTTTPINKLNFAGEESTFSPGHLGHITIGFEICYDNSGQDCALDTATIQTSVSLRDYSYVKDGSSDAVQLSGLDVCK